MSVCAAAGHPPCAYYLSLRRAISTRHWGHRMGVAVCARGGSLCVLWYTPCVRGAVARGAPFTSGNWEGDERC